MTQPFEGRLLSKSLAKRRVFHGIPRYVVEYLLAKFAPAGADADVARVQKLLQERHVAPEQREWVKDQLLRHGQFVLIDELEVQVDLTSARHHGRLPTLGTLRVDIPFELPEKHPNVLHGLWGTVKLGYDQNRRIRVQEFVPFQIGRVNLDEYQQERARFSETEWIILVLRSVGIETGPLSRRLQLLYLVRLAPLVEPNLHLMELGPRQTGKTFLLRNTSPGAFVVSGGRTTPATLFYHQAARRPGLLSTHQAVIFDEISHTTWEDPALLSTLKDYMDSGQFSRGDKTFHAHASLLFMGNAEREDTPLTQALPRGLRGDTAFLDRLHGLLPGFEFPKITGELLTDEPGLVTDYLAEVFKRLRSVALEPELGALLPPGLTQRDRRSVEKLVSGVLKLLYPARDWPQQTLEEVVALALELRGRVHRELHHFNPREFPHAHLGAPPAQSEPPAAALPAPNAVSEEVAAVVVPEAPADLEVSPPEPGGVSST
ncbi:BREX system Lon protease-like protein BrxL [Deinococcus aerophilus]|uniref:BREX system Lon protease-like BrxL N-terminal domain-containing protein n=1 Tax=Deinococcus aerophilus TaxID=522488 RepID=A0ABQ2GW52_9DEIO|nr:BREX system Lon protease-like protein BrxL [Deinococcus aerophilus]GGM16637.1 hypothetical protein GCM10010841_26180 [Deinococcus aerophilus]